jgi:hypothetical protein
LAGAAAAVVVAGLASPVAGAAAEVAGAAPGHGVIQVVHVTGGQLNTNQSDNWSGYNIGADYPQVAAGTTFTNITGEWTVPTAKQETAGQAEDSASWIGIGGGCVTDNCDVTDNTLIQAGTEQDVSATGQASYDAWWEIIPETETEVSLPVTAGNKIYVSIDGDRHSGTGLADMPKLGTVHFTDATLDAANPGFQTVDEIQLVSSSGSVIATPSSPGSAQNSYNDCVWATTCKAR